MTPNALIARLLALPSAIKLAAAGALVALIAISTVVSIVSHPTQALLFVQPLHEEQLAEVEERLAEWNVAFTPSQHNVSVDARRRNALLLRLSLAGVPHAHVTTSAETLATIGVLTPQAVIDAQSRSGLAGDIELALRSISGVDDASVIIAPAKAAEFADQQTRDATASVRLRLRPGAHLSHASIDGIRSFVAASVPGLDAGNVTLLDDHGVALGTDSADSADDENTLQSSLQSALDDALGAGATIVRVHAEYSSSDREQRDVRRTPVGAAIASDSTSESFDGTGKRYRKNVSHEDRGSDVREDVARVPAGTLQRVTTAVFLDASRRLSLPAVRALAAASVGYDVKRGDVLTVAAVDFHHADPPHAARWAGLFNVAQSVVPTLAVVLGLLVAGKAALPHIVALTRAHADRAAIARTTSNVAGFAPAQVRGALAHEPPHAAAAVISALPAATAAAVLELYPAHEREAIVQRMQRAHSPLIPDADEWLLTRG